MERYILLIFGLLLISWGVYRVKKTTKLFGCTKKISAFIELVLNGEASGIGQLLAGIVCLIIFAVSFFIK